MEEKKKKQKHTGNKSKELSSMEKKKKKKKKQKSSKSIHDILPLELIEIILLRVPINHLARLSCVSKLWHSIISDPHFADSHLHLSLAPTHVCLVINGCSQACSVDLDAEFHSHKYATVAASAAPIKEVSLPFKSEWPYEFQALGSCRGFVLLHRAPHYFVIWNPVTGSNKIICYYDIVCRSKILGFMFPGFAKLYGFGYDASQDDYLVVVVWRDFYRKHHLDCFSLKNDSWINLDYALPKPLGRRDWESRGFFLNGAIHWSSCTLKVRGYTEAILIFDLKERSFSKIPMPEQVMCYENPTYLAPLGGCLALYCHESHKTYIWVMKEYKVQSSWTLDEISLGNFVPLCLSNGSDIVALDSMSIYTYTPINFANFNVGGELVQRKFYAHPYFEPPKDHNPLWQTRYGTSYTVYTESLLPLPPTKKKKNGH